MNVFIVDDEVITAHALAVELTNYGYQARPVPSGEDCVRLITAGAVPDVILMDLNLGEGRLTGPEATTLIQQTCDTPVVLFSAYSDAATLQQTHEMVRYGYIHKVPGNLQIVIATIEMAAKLHSAERRLREREQTYRELLNHLQNVREDQNAVIARDIHDDLGQSLTALKMNLSLLKKLTERDALSEPARGVIGDMDEIINATVDKVRTIINVLRPPLLDTTGIVDALQVLATHVEHDLRVPVRLTSEHDAIDLRQNAALVLYRVVQEALTNAARHAAASVVDIRIGIDAGQVVAEVADDGCGFAVETVDTSRRFGIIGMRERVECVGGRLVVDSRPGHGTRVRVSLPLEAAT